tara:strand:- start:5790 stop:6566 length:777 start_codon:yes stop_codon:yes gene_type:complete
MSTVEIYKYTDINCSDIKIDKPDKKGTYYYGLVKYNKQNNLFVHLNNVKYKKYELSDIPTINIDIDDIFKDFLCRLDEHIIRLIQDNILDWFGKNIPDDVIKGMYKRTITKEESNNIDIRLPKLNDNIICKIYDSDKVRVDIDELKEDENISCIVNLKGIKITKKTLVFDISVNQIRLMREYIPNNIKDDECIVDTDDNKCSDEYIDNIDLEESHIRDKIKMLYSQKMEDIDMINQINTRIKIIDDEIKLLKYKINTE